MKPLEVKAYEIFKDKFGQENAETIVQFIETKSTTMFETHKDTLATKADLNLLKADLREVESHLKTELASLRGEFNELRAEVKAALSTLKSDLMQWCVAFWIGSVGTTALLFKIFMGK